MEILYLKRISLTLIILFISISPIFCQSNCDIYCPDDFSVELNDDGEYVVPDYYELGFVTLQTDECDESASVFQIPSPGTIMGLGEFEVNVTVQSLGESDDCDFEVVVVDQQGGGGDCDFDCPDDQVGNVDGDGNFVVPNYITNGALVISGDCGDFTSSQNPEAGTLIGEGVISVSLTADNGSSSISCGFNLSVGKTLSIAELFLSKISIYPNPSSGILNISASMDDIEVLSLTGTVILKSYGDQIDISQLGAGTYILKVTKNDATDYRRIVKY